MANQNHISLSVIKRLPRYYRYLESLHNVGVQRISSGELSELTGLTASQIRQDFNCFGGFGQQGYGYNVEQLYHEIGRILGLDKTLGTILIGAGNLGKAIAQHTLTRTDGFSLIGIFDENEAKAGTLLSGMPVMHISKLEDFCKEHLPKVAVFCTPPAAVDVLAKQLVELGVTNFWNFSNYDIGIKLPHVTVENVHLKDSLMTLCYRANSKQKENG